VTAVPPWLDWGRRLAANGWAMPGGWAHPAAPALFD
jgi:hypothetical protein